MLLALLFISLAHADPGWTELPHTGGDVTIEDARPKPSVTPQAVASQAPELESVQGLPPEDQELLRPVLERRKAFGAMNANNPMSEDFQAGALKEKLAQQLGFSPEEFAK